MRPSAIVNFERLFIASVVLGLVGLFLFAEPGSGLPLLELGVLALTLTLVLLVSRGRNNVVRWFLSIATVLGLPLLFYPLVNGEGIDSTFALSLLSSALQLGAVALLWTDAAKAWFVPDNAFVG